MAETLIFVHIKLRYFDNFALQTLIQIDNVSNFKGGKCGQF